VDFYFPSWWWNWILRQREQETNPDAPPLPSPNPSPAPRPRGIFRWLHTERDINAVSAAALDTAKRQAWAVIDKRTRIRQFRALTVLSLRVAALSPNPIPMGQLGPHLYSNADRNAAGSAIARTLVLLTPSHLQPASDIVSEEAQPARGVIETGFSPVITVLLITACAIAAAYLGTNIAREVRAINFDDELTKRLLAAQARAIEIVSMHIERERLAGHELPFDETERSWLLGLEDLQRQLATLMQRPMPVPFQGATEFVRAATSFIPMALLGIAAIWLLQRNERRN
jgi:hypothetical protein